MSESQRYRHRITFQEQLTVVDSSDGSQDVDWVDVVLPTGELLVDYPAEVLTGPVREFLQSGQVQGEAAARIACRWFPGLLQSWRIVWGDVVYNIGAFDVDRTARREYRIRCTAGVNDGQ